MYGNHLADRVCMGDYQSVDLVAEDVRSLTFTAEEVMELVTALPIWYWANEKGGPTLKNFDDIREAHAQKTYLEGRDIRRAMEGREKKWATRSVVLGAEAAELPLRTRGDQARLVRIAWDYTMHGGTRARYGMAGDNSCQICGGEDSAEHWMAQCPGNWPTANRHATRLRIQAMIDEIPATEALEKEFAESLCWLVEEAPGSGMHRMGLYLRAVVEAVFNRLGVQVLDAATIRQLRKRAVDMTKIWIEGVLCEHCYKQDGKEKLQYNMHFQAMKKRQKEKRNEAEKQAKLRKEKALALAVVKRRDVITEYFQMAKRDI